MTPQFVVIYYFKPKYVLYVKKKLMLMLVIINLKMLMLSPMTIYLKKMAIKAVK